MFADEKISWFDSGAHANANTAFSEIDYVGRINNFLSSSLHFKLIKNGKYTFIVSNSHMLIMLKPKGGMLEQVDCI